MKRTICVGVSRTFTGAETKKALSCLAGYPGWKSRALRYDSHSENFFMPYMAGFSYWDIKKFVAILDPGGWFYNMRANGEKMEKVCLDVIERLVDGSQGIVFDCTLVDLMAAKKRGFLTRNYLSIGYSVDQKWRVSWHGDFVGDSVLLRGEDFLRRLFDVVGIKFEEGELRVEERPIEGGPSYFAIRGKYSKMCVNRKITDVANPQEEKVICVGAFQEERLREFRSLENGEVAGEYIQVSGLSLARAREIWTGMERVVFAGIESAVGSLSLLFRNVRTVKKYATKINESMPGPWELRMHGVETKSNVKTIEEVIDCVWDGLELIPMGYFTARIGKKIMIDVVRKESDAFELSLHAKKAMSQKDARAIRSELVEICEDVDMFRGFNPEDWAFVPGDYV